MLEPEFLKPPADIFSVLRKFDPVENDVDRRILYEITGKKISHDWYWDTSDENDITGEVDPDESVQDDEYSLNGNLLEKPKKKKHINDVLM